MFIKQDKLDRMSYYDVSSGEKVVENLKNFLYFLEEHSLDELQRQFVERLNYLYPNNFTIENDELSVNLDKLKYDDFVDINEVIYGYIRGVIWSLFNDILELDKERGSKKKGITEITENLTEILTLLKKFELIEYYNMLVANLVASFPNNVHVDSEGNIDIFFDSMQKKDVSKLREIIRWSYYKLFAQMTKQEIEQTIEKLRNELRKMRGAVKEGDYIQTESTSLYSLNPAVIAEEVATKKQKISDEIEEDDSDSDTVSSDDEYESISRRPDSPKIEDVTDFIEPSIDVYDHPEYGPILVGDKGMTLYVFTKDEKDKSNCKEDCLVKWPPLLTLGEPKLSGRIFKNKISSTTLKDGHEVVTYFGNPLYYWYEDEKPGDIRGQNVGGVWYLVSAKNGMPVKRRRTPLKKESVKTEEVPEPAFKKPREKEPKEIEKVVVKETKDVSKVQPTKTLEIVTPVLPEIEHLKKFFLWCESGDKNYTPDFIRYMRRFFPEYEEQKFSDILKSPIGKQIICQSVKNMVSEIQNLFNLNYQRMNNIHREHLLKKTSEILNIPTKSNIEKYKQMINLMLQRQKQ